MKKPMVLNGSGDAPNAVPSSEAIKTRQPRLHRRLKTRRPQLGRTKPQLCRHNGREPQLLPVQRSKTLDHALRVTAQDITANMGVQRSTLHQCQRPGTLMNASDLG